MGYEDDIVYLKILLFTFGSAYCIRRIPCCHRDAFAALLGVSTIYIVCGCQLFYSLAVVLGNIAVVHYLPGIPVLNFVFSFAYLTFFRCAHLICGGGLLPKYGPHANAVQLIITLRCVGLAFEISDQRKVQLNERSKIQLNEQKSRGELNESACQMFFYCYNLFGLFTGPYYSYRVHQDMVQCKDLHKVPFASDVVTRLIAMPLWTCVFLTLQSICPVEDIHKDSFYSDNSFLFRLLYSAPACTYTRARFYVAWMLSEASCMIAGIGAYPKASKPKIGVGPSNLAAYEKVAKEYGEVRSKDKSNGGNSRSEPAELEYDYETIRNVDVHGCEFSYTFRDSIKSWNRSVQYWLAAYVYRRWPWKSTRTLVTMLVSAYWHGIRPGYYLSFMTIPLCLYAEDLAFSVMREKWKANESETNKHFRLVWWFFHMRVYDYLIMGFLLLSWNCTVSYWASMHYAFHILLVIVVIAFRIKRYLGSGVKEKI